METTPWKHCLEQLEGELSTQQFDTWIRPLHVIEKNGSVRLLAPNRFVQDWISERYLSRIQELLSNSHPNKEKVLVSLDVGSREPKTENKVRAQEFKSPISNKTSTDRPVKNSTTYPYDRSDRMHPDHEKQNGIGHTRMLGHLGFQTQILSEPPYHVRVRVTLESS